MFRIVRVAAHLLIQAVDHMFDGIHLHRAGARTASSSLNSGVVRRIRLFTRFTTVPKRLSATP